ncbi:hypothetical protein CC86DRAFT_309405, partial [Ophiobolus disseminans]
PSTYDHRVLKAMLPVRSAIFKQDTGGLVVRWVTTGEYPLLYVFVFALGSLYLNRYKCVTVWGLFFPTYSGASPVLRCDYPSCTSAVYSHSCIPTVDSLTQDNTTSHSPLQNGMHSFTSITM